MATMAMTDGGGIAPATVEAGASVHAHRYLALDSLRGVCACMVALLHFGTPGWIATSRFVHHASLFVDFFFVLSGFVIAASYGRRLADGFPITRFMGLRLGRIYPLHAFMLILFLVSECFFALAPGLAARAPFGPGYSLPMFAANALLIQIFVGPDVSSWNIPAWSIAAEAWTYLIFACLFRLAGRALMPLCVLIAIVAGVILDHATDRYINVFHDWAIVRCLGGFALGILAYRLAMLWRPGGSRMFATGLEVLAIVGTIAFVTFAEQAETLLAPPIFLLVVVLFAQEGGAVSALLRRPLPVFVGTLSYSIYMLHYFIQLRIVNVLTLLDRLTGQRFALVTQGQGGNHVGGSPLFGDAMSIVMLAVVIGGAWITYNLIEVPGRRLSRRWVLGDHPRRATLAAEREAPTF